MLDLGWCHFFFQAEDGIRDYKVTGVQTCALPISLSARSFANISLMAPFTAPVEPSDPTKARITAVSFGGSSGLNIDFSVDGGDNNDRSEERRVGKESRYNSSMNTMNNINHTTGSI